MKFASKKGWDKKEFFFGENEDSCGSKMNDVKKLRLPRLFGKDASQWR